MNSPEKDHRLVDFLYEELSSKEREAYQEHLEGNPAEARKAEAMAASLRLYRRFEPQSPSPALSQRIMAEAEKARQPLWSRIFGGLFSGAALRPAVGIAAMAILVVGVGVFTFLAGRGDPADRPAGSRPQIRSASLEKKGAAPGVAAESRPAPTAAPRAAEEDQGIKQEALALALRSGAKGARGGQDLEASNDAPANRLERSPGLKGGSGGRGKVGLNGLVKAKDKSVARDRRLAARSGGVKTRRPQKSAFYGAPVAKKPAAVPHASAAVPGRGRTARELQDEGRADALHNRANAQLNRGRLQAACHTYQNLAQTYRGYRRRADVLLEWARCELARGSFPKAQSLLLQVLKSYPKHRKAAQSLLAQVRTRWSQSKLASQRYQRAVRRKARARPARRTRRSMPSKATESVRGNSH